MYEIRRARRGEARRGKENTPEAPRGPFLIPSLRALHHALARIALGRKPRNWFHVLTLWVWENVSRFPKILTEGNRDEAWREEKVKEHTLRYSVDCSW